MEETISPDDTKKKIIELFGKAKKSILMSTELNSKFYNDDKVRKVMEEALKKVKSAKIIITNDIELRKKDVNWLFDIARQNNKIQIKPCKKAMHWLIIDDKHIRLEKPHKIGIIGKENLFQFDVPQIVTEILKKKFYSWWDSEKKH
ncbi:MAG: hypothetical protein EMLJLAPB_00855 [Candidatus Argoarchaeum ethanivorans]|uniref:Uncharacterized protein n=1 Tax=Candidatus Argoarchaeum ethanivorans TaxID=2608793 RepID=A0A811TGJ7_9EURY|nr:MAG: hypothetical protein EMLJLAPB_00855 [Candidatus Argoarchaeum ethanivorans]